MQRKFALVLTLGSAMLLSLIGIALIYSASQRSFGFQIALRQFLWLILGMIVAFIIVQLPGRLLYRLRWVGFGVCLVLLLLTLQFGVRIRGDRSWIDLGVFHLQASEITKVFLILVFADVSERYSRDFLGKSMTLVSLLAVLGAPLGLILMQTDVGTSLVYMGFFVMWTCVMKCWKETTGLILTGVGFTSGVFLSVLPLTILNPVKQPLQSMLNSPYGHFAVICFGLLFVGVVIAQYAFGSGLNTMALGFGIIVFFVVGFLFPPLLEEYQRQRLLSFWNPQKAPLESGYNVIQSKIAIGSGGWTGQGYMQGSQSQLGFIPELWTDFIFSVAIEELGLLFGLIVFGLLILLLYGLFSAAALVDDWRGYYFISGVGILWILHTVLNIGMCVGLIPVIGLPLPFMSYGGSFMVTNWILLGGVISMSWDPQSF